MADVTLTTEYQRVGTKLSKAVPNFYNYTFEQRLYARKSSSTVGRIYLKVTLKHLGPSSYYYGGTWGNSGGIWTYDPKHGNVNHGAKSYGGSGLPGGTEWTLFDEYAVDLGDNVTGTISTWTEYSWAGWSKSSPGQDSGTVVASWYTAPSTPSATIKELYTNGAKFGVSVSSYGTPASASGRYIEACISSTNDYFGTRRYGISGNVSSADITITNTSGAAGSLNIQPNSRYYYGAYANNTQLATYTMIGQLVTLPPALSAKSASAASTTSITVSATTAADGGVYAKNIQYNIGNGWVTGATVAAGTTAATAKSFTISGLSTGTAYTINLRVNTSAGNTSSGSVSATTYKVPNTPTTSATNASATSNTVTYGTTGFNTPNSGTVYLYGGTAASPTTQLTTKTTTGNSNYTHSSLTGNTKYYYRSRAKNTGGWSSYSSDATAITKPAAPTLAVALAGGQKQKKVTLTITSPSQGSAATMTAYYTVNGGSATSAGTVGSGSSVTANITTLPQTTYTIVAYLSNSSGSSSTVTKTITTGLPLYGRVNGSRKTIKKLYCSVNGQAKLVQHLYGSVNGQAKKIF